MTRFSRAAALPVAVLAAAASVAVSASGAAAAPYTPSPLITIGTTVPLVGGVVTGVLSGFDPGESIPIDLHTDVFHLTTVVANLLGTVPFVVTLPAGVECHHTLVATGATSGKVATTALNIGDCPDNGGGGDNGDGDHDGDGGDDDGDSDHHGHDSDDDGGSLPRTGAEVAGLGLLGLGLIGGGSTLVVRRRRDRS
jgi:LPXTG-motif cell wall-anchored protein